VPEADSELGERLAAQTRRLRLLIVHLAGRAIRQRVDPDDLVQEVFLRALASPGALPPAEPGEAALYRWLTRIARHTVIDVARAIRTRKREGAEAALVHSDWSHAGVRASQVAARTRGALSHAARREEHARLVAAFRELPPDHRRVLGLRQFEGLSAAETARRMGRSEAAVHSLYRRALAAWGAASERA